MSPTHFTNSRVSGDLGGHPPIVTLMSSNAMSLENPLPRIPSIIICKKTYGYHKLSCYMAELFSDEKEHSGWLPQYFVWVINGTMCNSGLVCKLP